MVVNATPGCACFYIIKAIYGNKLNDAIVANSYDGDAHRFCCSGDVFTHIPTGGYDFMKISGKNSQS